MTSPLLHSSGPGPAAGRFRPRGTDRAPRCGRRDPTRRLVDEILSFVDLSLDTCSREDSLPSEYKKDPFQRVDAYTRAEL